MLHGKSRKIVDIIASLFMLAALVLLLFGGVSVVLQTLDTYSVATNVNMAFINGTLPVMALAASSSTCAISCALCARPPTNSTRRPKRTREGTWNLSSFW